jgi:hypothetical protein
MHENSKQQQQQHQQTTLNETMNVSRSDDEEACHQMHAFMAYLPDELTASYREACRFVPELIEKESHPSWFLRYDRAKYYNDPATK